MLPFPFQEDRVSCHDTELQVFTHARLQVELPAGAADKTTCSFLQEKPGGSFSNMTLSHWHRGEVVQTFGWLWQLENQPWRDDCRQQRWILITWAHKMLILMYEPETSFIVTNIRVVWKQTAEWGGAQSVGATASSSGHTVCDVHWEIIFQHAGFILKRKKGHLKGTLCRFAEKKIKLWIFIFAIWMRW